MTVVLQRVVVAPAVILLTVVLLTTIPLWVFLAAVLSPLAQQFDPAHNSDLLVGMGVADDAAVYRINRRTAIVATLDFFDVLDDASEFAQSLSRGSAGWRDPRDGIAAMPQPLNPARFEQA